MIQTTFVDRKGKAVVVDVICECHLTKLRTEMCFCGVQLSYSENVYLRMKVFFLMSVMAGLHAPIALSDRPNHWRSPAPLPRLANATICSPLRWWMS